MSGFFKPSQPAPIIADITKDEMYSKLVSGALLIDSRTKEEFQAGHLENAINIPHTETAARLSEFGTNKNLEIILYCKSGGRSSIAQKFLKSQGFTNVFNAGGYEALRITN